ncbi:two-component sensor histidine kinase [Compostibacillus humi]|uniref:histidine kinase n=1 Tax=Compostibacillus humi TaxID=1245525 RepID=A0A8J2XIK5_9BACI|nr:HAMP domain-containing sensor histidine kinase [Compostibacillus humi]GFZ80452.1 two-component sensor histidine kinase [Compostibacillus humi]
MVIALIVTLVLIAIFLIARLLALKKEMKNMVAQLQKYNNRQADKKIDLSLFDKNLEQLGTEVNKLMDLYVDENRKRTRFEKELKQMIANMSHDLRTPLTSITGYIQMAEKENIPPEERGELLAIAKNRAKRLESLLNEFFELSVIESNDYLLKSEGINLRNVTIEVLISFYDRFQEKGLEPVLSITDEDVFIRGDTSAAARVMENLFANAIKHSEGKIQISLQELNGTARLIVKNDASSLTDEAVRRMFDRFYMADQSRTGKSTGLGLSIVKSLMEKMGGKVTAKLKDEQLSIICEWKSAATEEHP